jgi:hypothetical protein
MPSHLHSTRTGGGPFNVGGGTEGSGSNSMNSGSTGGGQSHDHTLSANFSGTANSVLQPGLVLNYIIKT